MKKEEELQDLVRECIDTGVVDSEIFRRAKELGYSNNKRILETIIEGRRERIDVVKRFRGSTANKKEEAKEKVDEKAKQNSKDDKKNILQHFVENIISPISCIAN